MGAMQAQIYQDALWAVGLRLKNTTSDGVANEIANRSIVRTWPMRQTLHFASPKDVRMMLSLYPKQKIPKYQHGNGLTEQLVKRGEAIIVSAFNGKRQLTSKEIYNKMRESGISVLKKHDVQQHILRRAGREGIVCYGPNDGKRQTFVLLNEWVPKSDEVKREDALAALAKRYFMSHGPATVRDFAWWSGISVSDAKSGIEKNMSHLAEEKIGDKTYILPKDSKAAETESAYLLPAFDEYIISYADRNALLMHSDHAKSVAGPNGFFSPTIVIDGKIVGVWKREIKKDHVLINLSPLIKLNKKHKRLISEAAGKYGKFLEMEVQLKYNVH